MKRWLCVALLGVWTATGRAESGTDFAGNYVFSGSTNEVQGVSQAIDQAVAKCNPFVRILARGRLKDTNKPFQTIRFTFGATNEFQRDSENPILFDPARPAPVDWRRSDGKTYKVAHVYNPNAQSWTQTFTAEDGSRVNVFQLAEGGHKLSMQVTVRSPKLKEPVVYSLTFARADK